MGLISPIDFCVISFSAFSPDTFTLRSLQHSCRQFYAEATFHVLPTQDNRKKNAASSCIRGGDGRDERSVLANPCQKKRMENGSDAKSASTEVSVEESEEEADSSQVTSTSSSPHDPSKSPSPGCYCWNMTDFITSEIMRGC